MERLTFNMGSLKRQVSARGTPKPALDPATSRRRSRIRLARTRERYDWDYLWLLAFTAMLFFRPQDHVPALESLHLAELTAIAGLAAMAVRRLRAGQAIAKITPEVVGVVLLGAVIVLTVPFSFWPGGSLAVFTEIYVKIALIFALMISTITTPRRLQQMTWLMILASGYIAGRGVRDYLAGVNLIEGDRLAGAVGGMFRNPNDLALNLVTFLAPTLFMVVHEKRAPRRLAAGVMAALMVTATAFTKSRSGFLGLVAMTAVVVYYSARVKPGLVLAFLVVGLLALPAMPTSFWNRMDSIINASEDATGSRAARIRLLNQAVDVFADNPLTGIGAGQFANYNGPGIVEKWRVTHNVWLQVAAELGIFGLAAFAFLVIRAFAACLATLRLLRRSPSRVERPFRTGRDASREHQPPADDRQISAIAGEERQLLELSARSMLAGLVGWTVCSLFASVAFNWTFYFVLALAVAGREIAVSRPAAPATATSTPRTPRLVGAPA